jgi:PAS domain S-box-containing protein
MPDDRPSLYWYAGAVAAVVVAVGINLAFEPWIRPNIFPPFLIAVFVCSRYGGLGPGLTASALSFVVSSVLLIAGLSEFLSPFAIIFRLAMFSAVEILIIYLMVARKRSDEMLRKLWRAVEQSPASVMITDLSGAIEYVNPKFTEVSSYTLEEVRGQNPSILKSGETPSVEYRRLWETIRAGGEWRGEFHNKKKNGELYWESASISPGFDRRGIITHFVAVKEDITERKRLEEAARAAAESKDRFLAVLSHELRTPLTPVLMTVTAMLEGSEMCQSYGPNLEMIRDNVELEARLIDDLLDLSRLAKGQMEYRFETVDADVVILRGLEICRAAINLKGHHLEQDLAATKHHVRADPARLQQVVWNLVMNAVKYTPDDGRIAVRSRVSSLGRLEIQVADNGVGISPEDLPHIFDPFRQGWGAKFSNRGGLGLGLAISRWIIEAHDGTLTCSSDGRNKGATFTLVLPIVPAPPEPGGTPAEPIAINNRPLRILLAEDNHVAARVFAQVLSGKGHEVTVASCLRRGLEAASNRFDLVVSDLDLGDGSGLELMRHVRSLTDTPGIAIIGYATRDDVRQSLEAGFAVHLAKPVTFATLESAIHQVTARPL